MILFFIRQDIKNFFIDYLLTKESVDVFVTTKPKLSKKILPTPLALVLLAILGINGFALFLWCMLSRYGEPLFGIGALAYFFGVRHAFDVDHIAAIDNVTRKLRQDGKKPIGVGLFFSFGHSTVVIALSLVLVITVRLTTRHLGFLQYLGDVLGTAFSAIFLTIIGLMNLYILKGLWRILKNYGENSAPIEFIEKESHSLLERRGLMSRIFRRLYQHIEHSWQMYPIGFLFGLGFDTATEIAVLGISAAFAQHDRFPLWGIMVFPLLFTAGMSLMDTLDGFIMIKIYDWAMMDMVRKVFFNTAITGLGVLVALLVGMIEWLQLFSSEFQWQGSFWSFMRHLDFSILGGSIVILLIFIWGSAWFYYRRVEQTK